MIWKRPLAFSSIWARPRSVILQMCIRDRLTGGVLAVRSAGITGVAHKNTATQILSLIHILISLAGIIIRMHVADINVQSRYGSGVRVMRLGEGDRVVTVARTERSDEEEVAKPEDGGEDATEEEIEALSAQEESQEE